MSLFKKNKSKSQKYSDDYFYFDDKYFFACQKWEERIDDIDTNTGNPEKNIKAYEKKISTALDFKAFCESKRGGAEYYKYEYPSLISDIQKEYQNYKTNEYHEEKETLEIEKKEKAIIKKLSKKIVKIISDGTCLQTEIKDKLTGEEQIYFDRAIFQLMSDGEINKGHEGKRVVYSLVRKCPSCGVKDVSGNYCWSCGAKL